VKNITDFKLEDFELIGYEHEKGIKGAVSIWMKTFNFLEKPREVSLLRLFLFQEFLCNS
jgi:hypothetical protein